MWAKNGPQISRCTVRWMRWLVKIRHHTGLAVVCRSFKNRYHDWNRYRYYHSSDDVLLMCHTSYSFQKIKDSTMTQDFNLFKPTTMIFPAARLSAASASIPFFKQVGGSTLSVMSTSSRTTSCVSCSAAPNPFLTTMCSLLVRGGEVLASTPTGGDVLDLKRVGIRLEALNSYGVITALLMNAALRIYSSTPKTLRRENDIVEKIARVLFLVSVCVSVLAGSYTTIVFSLLGLYSKSAIGLGMDDAFVEFFKQTYGIRQLAFSSFILSLISFEASFVLSLFLCYDGPLKWCATLASAVAAGISWNHWRGIMDIAGKFLFSG